MKSTTGAHYIALDHVRALAAMLVFFWHFIHAHEVAVPFDYAPLFFPLAIIDEGHTGVALFMTLSGYLFAKLLVDKKIHYRRFIWNRVLRLLPLLILVTVLAGVKEFITQGDLAAFIDRVRWGFLLPGLPNGGWSITVEFHYYLILPALLWMLTRSTLLPLAVIVLALLIRQAVYSAEGGVQHWSYLTILGRIDQFVFGMVVFKYRHLFVGRHLLSLGILCAFLLYYWVFDLSGGYKGLSSSMVWVFMPSIEGFSFAVLIAWYEGSFAHSNNGFSRLIGRVGEASYSIYLMHFFVVFFVAKLIDTHVMDISNFFVACIWSAVLFVLIAFPCYFSYKYIEMPWLKLRKNYLK